MPGSASAIRLPYVPQPRQKVLHQAIAREILYGGQAGGGKLVSLATYIPTPHGWTTMGEIAVGDQVFDETGTICNVIGKSDVQYEQTFELEFSNDAKIIAGARHQWITSNLVERAREIRCTDEWRARRRSSRPIRGTGKRPDLSARNRRDTKPKSDLPFKSIRTTREIAESIIANKRINHSIAVAKPLHLPETELLVEPYVLGAWLGDGSSRAGVITGLDEQIFEEIAGFGYTVTRHACQKQRGILRLVSKLKTIGIYGNKHIPPAYLRASLEQRIALLQGLMDTDGHCDSRGQCEITLTRKALIDDVSELLSSLGIKHEVRESEAKIDGRYISQRWRIKFLTHLPAFRLARKLIRQKRAGFRGTHDKIYIVACLEVPQVPLQCIEVDSPSHCYLVGESMIQTHNSFGLRWDAIDFCLHLPGFFAGIFRRTNPELEENHISFIREELAALSQAFKTHIGKYNETRKRVEFVNGSHIRFKHLELEKDAHDIQGWELHGAYPDEAALMEPGLLAYIRSRIRLGRMRNLWESMALQDPAMLPYIARVPRFVLGSNPGGPSHHWLKENFIDPAPPETMFEITTGSGRKRTRIFIPASMRDNQYLDESYEDQFDDLPEWQRKQLRDGDWNTVPGAFFDCWSPANTIRPFSVPDYWTRMWSCDWGFRQPFWIGEWVVSDGNPVKNMAGDWITFPEECMILVREWYGREKGNKGIRMPAYEVGRALRDWAKADIKVADPSMWRSDSGPSPAERMAQAGIYWTQADNERVPGWQEMYARIKDGMLLSFDTCSHFLRIIPTLTHDEKNPEDVLKRGEDHPGDGCFVADTLIRTTKGLKRIEDLIGTVGYVHSIDGPLRYMNCRKTRKNAELVEVTFDDGTVIRCTPDHRFMTTEGWKNAVDLTDSECYASTSWSSLSLKQSKNSSGFVTTDAALISKRKERAFIGGSGNIIAGKSRMDLRSTMWTRTRPTIRSRIFNAYLGNDTLRFITFLGRSLKKLENWLLNGTRASAGGSGTADITRSIVERFLPGEFRKFAYVAGMASPAPIRLDSVQITANPNGAGGKGSTTRSETARPVATHSWLTVTPKQKVALRNAARKLLVRRALNVSRLDIRADVYCLEVHEVEAFALGNGVIVHNCRYACMGRPYKKDRPKKKRSWQEEAVRVPTFNEIMNRRTPAQGPEII